MIVGRRLKVGVSGFGRDGRTADGEKERNGIENEGGAVTAATAPKM